MIFTVYDTQRIKVQFKSEKEKLLFLSWYWKKYYINDLTEEEFIDSKKESHWYTLSNVIYRGIQAELNIALYKEFDFVKYSRKQKIDTIK